MGTKRKVFIFLVFGAAIVGLMAVGAVWDFEISQGFADPGWGWARVMEVIAEPPTILLCSFMCAVICIRAVREKKILLAAFMAVAEAGTAISVVVRTCAYVGYDYVGVIPVIVTAATAGVMFAVGYGVERRIDGEIVRTMLSCVIASLVTLVVINLLKGLWGRVRYRDMMAAGSFDDFTAWYVVNGINGHKSFPSGHTSNVVLLFYLTYFAKYLRSSRKRTIVIVGCALTLWAAVTMVSRVAVGAHYLSDVTAGAAITAAIVCVTGKIRNEFD